MFTNKLFARREWILNVKMEGGVLPCAGEGNTTSFKCLSYGDFLNRRFMVSCVSLAPYGVFWGHRGLYSGSHSELKELWLSRLLLMEEEHGFHWILCSSAALPGEDLCV